MATGLTTEEHGRRRAVCRDCSERPAGCWKAREYGCQRDYLAAQDAALEAAACPVGKLQPGTIWLPGVKTFVYTMPWQTGRQERVRHMLDGYGFRDWQFFFGTQASAGSADGWGRGKDYWAYIPPDHARLLRENDAPLLILEDDIEPRDYRPTVAPPPGAEIVYLGGGRGGSPRGVRNAMRRLPAMRPIHRYCYAPIDADWMRIAGMWFTHAILYVDRRAMLEVADALAGNRQPIDTTLAQQQWRWRVVCRRLPYWWQNDGHHRTDTYDYAPPPEQPETLADRRRRQRAKRRRVLGLPELGSGRR